MYPNVPSIGRATYTYHYTDENPTVKTGYLQSITDPSGLSLYRALANDPFGNVASGRFGNTGPYEQFAYDPGSGRMTASAAGATLNGTSVQNFLYRWTAAGDLDWRQDANAARTEDFGYDSLHRLTAISLSSPAQTATLEYHDDGNIKTKSDVSNVNGYSYGQAGAFPHAVTQISGTRAGKYHYDPNGNMDCRHPTQVSPCPSGSQINWNVANLPQAIYTDPDDYVAFTYGPDRERVRQTVYVNNVANRTVTYVAPHFEVEILTNSTKYRSTVFFGDRAVYQRVDTDGGYGWTLDEYYLLRDHQGSLVKFRKLDGTQQTLSFDAFGKRRNPNWTADPPDSLMNDSQWYDRGYTGHEHLDPVKLIHMNGRVQDPIIGRMLSPDPLIGSLGDPQSLNRYSYVRNNPLALVDPSGFWFVGCDSDPLACSPPPPPSPLLYVIPEVVVWGVTPDSPGWSPRDLPWPSDNSSHMINRDVGMTILRMDPSSAAVGLGGGDLNATAIWINTSPGGTTIAPESGLEELVVSGFWASAYQTMPSLGWLGLHGRGPVPIVDMPLNRGERSINLGLSAAEFNRRLQNAAEAERLTHEWIEVGKTPPGAVPMDVQLYPGGVTGLRWVGGELVRVPIGGHLGAGRTMFMTLGGAESVRSAVGIIGHETGHFVAGSEEIIPIIWQLRYMQLYDTLGR